MKRMHQKKIGLIVIAIILLGVWSNCVAGNLEASVKNLVGVKYIYPQSTDIISKYGVPETLSGTNNTRWVAYFPKGDFTIITDKNSDIIKKVLAGKRPQ